MSIVRQNKHSQHGAVSKSNNNQDDQTIITDEIFEVLSSLLEYGGILPGNKNNDNGDDAADADPWYRLSNSLKEFIISLGKLHKLVSAADDTEEEKAIIKGGNNNNTTTDDIHNNNSTAFAFDTTNELLLTIESTVHQVRANAKSVSIMLAKGVSAQLNMCRTLESISRNKNNNNTSLSLSLSTQLLPMAKSLAGAVRQQKALWLQSLQVIEESIDQIYTTTTTDYYPTEVIDNLQLVYKRINRRCIYPDRSPWKEAVMLLECVASVEISSPRDTTNTTGATTTKTAHNATECCQDNAMIVNLPRGRTSCCSMQQLLPAASRFIANKSNCASSQLQNMVADFFNGESKNNNGQDDVDAARVLSILVVGPEGSGKTHLLNEIEKQSSRVTGGVDVVHPVLPFDAIGTTVGAAEDILISMVSYAKTNEGNCLLLLDDIDSICGQTEQSSTTTTTINSSGGRREPHLTARLRHIFFSLLDIIQERNYDARNGRMVLICSSKENFGKDIDRFDKILPLLPPNGEERRRIISNYAPIDISVDNLVEYTLGLSRAELAHYCREALMSLHSRRGRSGNASSTNHDFLSYLKEKLQSSTPDSLKHGVNADFVDMKVFSARDLQQLYPIQNPENPIADLPLFGESAKAAWRELRRLVVLPVCQGPALDKIMYHRGGDSISGKKTFAGGVLLAASPGTGKSTLAYFCAAVASSINHSIKLIDVSCTSLIHKEVGGSERALHRLFQSARSATPCIIVMDGIENIGAVRGNDNTTEGTMDRVLSTLLTELDGVESEISTTGGNSSVGCMAIIGITHNASWIDPALRRPGRLERTIWLDNPDLEGRERIIMNELGNAVFKPDDVYPELQTLDDLAMQVALETDGHTGAEVIAICNESKLMAFNNFFKGNSDGGAKKDFITPQLVFEAVKAQRSADGGH